MAKDLLYEDDIVIDGGDFATEESDSSRIGSAQHIKDILLDSQGQWYQSPLVGVGVSRSINGQNDPLLKSEIVKQLSEDNFKINQISVTFVGDEQDIFIDAEKQ